MAEEKDEIELDIEAYYQEVKALISTSQDKICTNDHRIKTSIVMRCMFELAQADIKIFCGKFSVFRTEFQNNLSKKDPETAKKELINPFKKAVEDFLKKGHKIIAIMENPDEWEQETKNEGYFPKLFRQYSKQIELKTTKNRFNKLVRISHFYIAPTITKKKGSVRWEVDEEHYKAIVSPSQKLYETYNKAFDKINKYSVQI